MLYVGGVLVVVLVLGCFLNKGYICPKLSICLNDNVDLAMDLTKPALDEFHFLTAYLDPNRNSLKKQ